jgi:hypothetical protein
VRQSIRPFTLKHFGGRTRHIHTIVGFRPVQFQIAAR